MKDRADLSRALIAKAIHDLEIARIGLSHEAPLDTIAFHIQQCAEKVLKAFLAFKEVEFPRTHDLKVLLDLAIQQAPQLELFREPLLAMSSYAVEMRYDVDFYPGVEEITSGLEHIQNLLKFIQSLIPTLSK